MPTIDLSRQAVEAAVTADLRKSGTFAARSLPELLNLTITQRVMEEFRSVAGTWRTLQ